MGASVHTRARRELHESHSPRHVTLLELVTAVAESTSDDREIVATVRHMLRSGNVMLCGNFRGESPDSFDS
jgi:hypothetical protein